MKRVENLRPVPGEPNTIRLADGFRYARIISKRFLCEKCNVFCGEMVPILDRAAREILRRQKRTMFDVPVKVYCFNGCHDHPSWGWRVFDWKSAYDRNRVAEWPEEWKTGRKIEDMVRRGGPDA